MLKKMSCVILSMVLCILCLTACGGKDMSDSKYVGTWTGTKAEYAGFEMSVEELFGDFTLTLQEDGKAVVFVDGEEEKGNWDETEQGVSLDGEMEFIADGDALTYETEGVIVYFEKK